MHPKKVLKLLVIIFLPLSIQILAVNKNKMRLVKEVVIDHQDSNMFITDEEIHRSIIKDPMAPMPLGLLRLHEFENILDNNDMIENSEVFYTIDGTLHIKVKQRDPIARIYDDDKTYYMDNQGKKMPLSKSFSARVPIVRGEINKYWDTTYQLMMFILNDTWLTENITEVIVKNNGEYDFYMRIPHFRVSFGKYENEMTKKANLKAFYKLLENTNQLNEYSIVNLKYSNQVVCKR